MTTRQSVVVAAFTRESDARQALSQLSDHGVKRGKVGILAPGSSTDDPSAGIIATAFATAARPDLVDALSALGVSDGDARFYADEAARGSTLVVAEADSRVEEIRQLVIAQGGYDVRSRGAELARNTGAGVPGGADSRPIDATWRWQDVRSRYQMLWEQHYGTTDATWEEMEPIYEYAWQAANDPETYGRPWSEAEPIVRRRWQSASASQTWEAVSGPMRDVWEDVAEEAAQGTEGGADRRIPGPGTDQSIAARDLHSVQ